MDNSIAKLAKQILQVVIANCTVGDKQAQKDLLQDITKLIQAHEDQHVRNRNDTD